ncbi:hypothetical protein C8Q73DRAFT_113709 [Cubamyces lactineus]|nr:hypothetical protein C8Q73DRAFT_113709 [Cubamyces lactineus]
MKWTLRRSVLAAGARTVRPAAPLPSGSHGDGVPAPLRPPARPGSIDSHTHAQHASERGSAEHQDPKSVRTYISGGFLYVCLDVCWEDGMANGSRYVRTLLVGRWVATAHRSA